MTIAAGSRLGPYEVLSPLGAGGMGEVYRAKDTRLDRTVAIKVLPSHLSESAELKARFEREAKTISQLSHPHICALHDVGSQDGVEYLVMEYLEGETLSDRLSRGPLPPERTLRYGIEMADALDRAHRQGVVHRDLKPGNVMITRSGVKLLDFGLAKTFGRPLDAAGGEQAVTGHRPLAKNGLTSIPTVAGSPNLTQEGTIFGTFQYMAPEQLEGKEADARTDIFAFGTVLYEMATGKKAFSGTSQASLVTAIMSSEPPAISSIQPMTPPALDRVVKTCLAKAPDDRWQSAHDIASELKWIGEGSQAGIPEAVSSRRRSRERLAWSVAAAAVLAALYAVAFLGRRPAPSLPLLHVSLLPPEGCSFDPLAGPMALSPDGSRIAFGARDAEGKTMLWVRALDSPSAQSLAGTEGARYPFWSPNGRSVGFFSGFGLAMIPAAGGAVEKISDAGIGRGATWSRDGVILLAAGFLNPITRVSLADRQRVPVTKLDEKRGETGHTWPHFLPDGRHFLYLVQRVNPQTRRSEGEVYVQELGSNKRKLLLRSASRTLYAPPGHLLFWWDGNLMAQPFDVRGLRLAGDAFAVAKGVQHLADSNAGVFSISGNGLLAYAEGGPIGLSQLTIFDRGGKPREALGTPGNIWTPHLSRDGRRAAAEAIDPVSNNRDIAVFDLAGGGSSTRVTFDPGEDLSPVFSPDGSRVAFSSFRNGAWAIFEKTLGGPEEQPIFPLPGAAFLTDWSPDGRFLAFNRSSPETSDDIWLLSVAERKAETFLRTPAQERDLVFSPDGKWVAYFSAESGRPEIYVRPFPGPGGKWQVSTSGGTQPRWRSDGKELYYVAPGGKLMAVPVKAGATFEAGAPQVLFQTLFRQTVIAQYDVFPVGQRFIVNNIVTAKSSTPITLVQSWREAAR